MGAQRIKGLSITGAVMHAVKKMLGRDGSIEQKNTETNAVQLDRTNYVLSVTEADDYVHDGVPYFKLFGKDIDFFWFSVKPGRAPAISDHCCQSNVHSDLYIRIDGM